MAEVTYTQKQVLVKLAAEFYPRVHGIFAREPNLEITAQSEEECAVIKSFSQLIVEAVGKKYPGDEHEDVNDDAVLSVFISDRIISEYARNKLPGQTAN